MKTTSPTPPPDGLAPAPGSVVLTDSERRQIAEILGRRANEIAGYSAKHHRPAVTDGPDFPGSVALALDREIQRLRRLEGKLKVPTITEDDDE